MKERERERERERGKEKEKSFLLKKHADCSDNL